MKAAYLKIELCGKCPHKLANNHTSSDGWDRMEDWVCTKKENKLIQPAVEWHEEKKITPPKWCPLMIEI